MIFVAICGPPSGRASPDRREAHKWHGVTVTGRRSTYRSAQTVQTNPAGSEIAASVLHSYAVEGIRLDLTVDVYPVSVNVAMPTGMVVNELLTNALKHAFVGREGGTITVNSFSGPHGCRITVADDGVGLPEGVVWPKRGKLSALIVQSLRENAKANLTVESTPGQGMRVIIEFTRAAAAPIHPM